MLERIMANSELVSVASLYKQCSYPVHLETDFEKPRRERIVNRGGHAASDNCNLLADTVVVVDNGKGEVHYEYRCKTHRGKISPVTTGKVRDKIKRQAH